MEVIGVRTRVKEELDQLNGVAEQLQAQMRALGERLMTVSGGILACTRILQTIDGKANATALVTVDVNGQSVLTQMKGQ